MKAPLALTTAVIAGALWAMDPIRINFNSKSKYDVAGWTSVTYQAATNGVDCGDGVTMKVTGGKGWLYGDGSCLQTNALQKLYIDDGSYDNPTKVSFTGLLNVFYTVRIYLASDNPKDETRKQFNQVSINGTWYRYNENGALVEGYSQWGSTLEKGTVVGTNVMEWAAFAVLDSKLELKTCRDFGRGGVAAVEIVPYEYTAETPSTISINVACNGLTEGCVSENIFVPGLAGGEIPGYSWLNVSAAEKHFDNVAYWDGEEHQMVEGDTSITVDVSASGGFHDGSATGENGFLCYYLDDNNAKTSITVAGIPFKQYDVIVYMNNDWNNGSHKAFNSVKVNGTHYLWDDEAGAVVQSKGEWGQRGVNTAILGTNSLRIADLTESSLSVDTGARYAPARGGFAAMQIVKHDYADIVATGDISTREINKLAGTKKEVWLTLPDGATLTINKNELACDKLYVVSTGDVRIATWNNIAPVDREAENAWYATNFAKINVDKVKGLVFHGWKPTKRILSLNFNSTANSSAMPATWTFGGALAADEVVSASWNNLTNTTSGTSDAPVVWNGELLVTNTIENLSVAWANAHYYKGGSSKDVFRRSWIDGSSYQAVITVDNLPFDRYDVLVYMNWDGGSHDYGAPWVNGYQWTYDSETNLVVQGSSRWGNNGKNDSAEMKVNAIRVPDQTDSTCVIKTAGYCGNICAVQIIEYCPPVKEHREGLVILVR